MSDYEQTEAYLSIASVERDTGLGKDTLRVWEKRYGFPTPLRNANGERIYPLAQVEKLRQVKQLLDHGLRPGKVLAASDEERAALFAQTTTTKRSEVDARFCRLLDMLRLHRSEDLRRNLQQLLLKQGLQSFVSDIVAPMNREVGEAWMRGDIDVAEEHLYTEHVQNILRGAISVHSDSGQRPRVLLTTFPEEIHTLGLLMAEAMLVPEGACCVSLGSQTPIASISAAAIAGAFDIIALSFSGSYPTKQAIVGLQALAQALPETATIWVGGRALVGRLPTLPRLRQIGEIAETLDALQEWRSLGLS